jgi:hypothetical protein
MMQRNWIIAECGILLRQAAIRWVAQMPVTKLFLRGSNYSLQDLIK